MSKAELLYQQHLDSLREKANEKNILFVDALMAVQRPFEKNALLAVLLRGKNNAETERDLIRRYRLEFFEWIANDAININQSAIEAMANNKAKEMISIAQKKAAKKGGDAKAAKLKEPKDAICQAWGTGNFESRDICAEQEYSSLGFGSFKAARNALVDTSDPAPWPARKKGK